MASSSIEQKCFGLLGRCVCFCAELIIGGTGNGVIYDGEIVVGHA